MRALLILFAIFLLYRIVFGYLLPYYIGKTIQKTHKRMYRQNNGDEYYQGKEGEIRIEHSGVKPPKRDPGGEYVDYVEIK